MTPAFSEKLREAGLKITRSRTALLEALAEGHGPFTPEELFSKLDPNLCDLVTVYRTLTTFEEKGLVRRCEFGDGRARYELEHGDHHHHHLVCRRCAAVKPLDHCSLEILEKS
ncbi:transcriptional repressor, partial [bacterium]|nr:transcriptional repressor [bacterium]